MDDHEGLPKSLIITLRKLGPQARSVARRIIQQAANLPQPSPDAKQAGAQLLQAAIDQATTKADHVPSYSGPLLFEETTRRYPELAIQTEDLFRLSADILTQLSKSDPSCSYNLDSYTRNGISLRTRFEEAVKSNQAWIRASGDGSSPLDKRKQLQDWRKRTEKFFDDDLVYYFPDDPQSTKDPTNPSRVFYQSLLESTTLWGENMINHPRRLREEISFADLFQACLENKIRPELPNPLLATLKAR
ncbi:hypothetical protein FJY90_07420 [Candidatus Gottesmanbacteria bacterium]|nr:hypothetical protein [Candidatus Gottesmanbacteria bacterium]